MLEFVYAAHELFERTRSFVFVSELGETTALFEARPAREAAAARVRRGRWCPSRTTRTTGASSAPSRPSSSRAIDRRTTVVILGDGRTNYHDAAEETLARIRTRARALYWFCSELARGWSTGDSAMQRYASHCTKVLEVSTARELEEATRTLVWGR